MPRCKLILVLVAASAMSAQDLARLARAYRSDPTQQNKAAVAQFAGSHRDAEGALALLVLGSKELERKEYAEALAHLDGVGKRLPAVADYPAYFAASARFEREEYAEVERELKPVWGRTPSSPLTGSAAALLANAWLKNGEPRKALNLVNDHRQEMSPPEAELILGRATEALGDQPASKAHFQKLLTEYPLYAESELNRVSSLAPKARLARAIRMIDGSAPERGREELEQLLPELGGADLEVAQVKLGVAQFATKGYSAAFDALRNTSVKTHEAECERLYYMLRCARKLDKPLEFKPILDRFSVVYPSSAWRLQSLLAAGDYYFLKNDAASYEPVYRSCAASFASDPKAAECQWRAAWAAYIRRQTAAQGLFRGLVSRYPASDKVSNALYFLGRIAESKGDWSAARAYYDEIDASYANYFYGALARERLRSAPVSQTVPSTGVLSFLRAIQFPQRRGPDNFEASAATKARFVRAGLLAMGGLDDLSDRELRFGARAEGQPEVVALEMADLATLREAPDLAIRYIKQLAPNYLHFPIDSVTDRFWKLAFPIPYRALLEQFSGERGLDPFLVAALIRQESEFNPKVISRAKAYGLTQLLPSTGLEIGRKLKLSGLRADMLFKPEVNLRIGTYFLRSLLDRAQGKWEETLAAYNAGPGRVVQWRTWADFREPAEFIETIPFDETRNYVQSVLRNADLYRRLYGVKPGALASTDGDSRKDAGSPGGNRKPAPAVP